MLVADDVGLARDLDGAVGELLHLLPRQHLGEDVGGGLVVGGHLLGVGELLLELFDLVVGVVREDVGELVLLELVLHLGLGAAALGAGLEQVVADAVGRYMEEHGLGGKNGMARGGYVTQPPLAALGLIVALAGAEGIHGGHRHADGRYGGACATTRG